MGFAQQGIQGHQQVQVEVAKSHAVLVDSDYQRGELRRRGVFTLMDAHTEQTETRMTHSLGIRR